MSPKHIRRIRHFRASASSLAVIGMVVCFGLARPAYLTAAPSPRHVGGSQPGGVPPSCLGANDLLVSGETIVMTGSEVLDHLCVANKGKIVGSGDLHLTVGALYVDSSSAISVDGHAGDLTANHDCAVILGSPNGSAGHALIIVAYQATVEGSLSADGGRTWQRSPGTVARDSACRATFDPLDLLHIYLSCYAGVYVSNDGGHTWSNGANLAGVGEVLVSRGHPGLAYVVGRDRRSTAYNPGKVFRTTDGGVTWQPWAGGDMLASDTIVGIAGFVP